MNKVQFFAEGIDFTLNQPEHAIQWLQGVVKAEGQTIKLLNIIFCSDNFLHDLNIRYLDHDTLTDIITFEQRDSADVPHAPLDGELYISVERVYENAHTLGCPFVLELHRVMVHGVLHLLGYHDKLPEDQQIMRQKEDRYLADLPAKVIASGCTLP